MNEAEPPRDNPLSAELKQRCAADLAAGRTVSLAAIDMARPEVREHLPQLLEELARTRDRGQHTGLRVSGYTILGEIGRGGMSTVYLARHDTLGRHVALKIVPNWSGGQQRARERLLHEARAMASVSHPNIVAVHDIVEDGDTIAIAMEWIDGMTLAGILLALPDAVGDDDMAIVRRSLGTPAPTAAQLEPTTTRFFARMARDVARAVHAVHQQRLLHLDIKPSNVLVRRDGTPLLADFGVVRELDLVLTHTRSFAGTPIYAAPEQLHRDDRSFGPPTDVYGLGITLYELLARSQPLRGSVLTQLVSDVMAGRIPALSSLAPVPHDLENIVHKAIAPEPARRYATAAAFADDLTAFLDGRPVVARPITRVERIGRWMRAEPWKALLAAVLIVMVPIVAGLGIKVLTDMPRIADSRQRDLRADAYRWEQQGIQHLLIRDQENDAVVQRLRQIREADPDNLIVLACLLTMLGHGRGDEARAELAQQPALLQRHRGLQLFDKRLVDRRPFFNDAEVDELIGSKDRLDMLLAILSRILEVQDTQVVDPLELLRPAFDLTMATSPDQDPLLHGLQAWVAAKLGDHDQIDISCRALEALWPDDATACWWRMLAVDLVDPKAARQIGAEFGATHPGNVPSAVMVSRSFVGERRFAKALEALDAGQPPPDDEVELHNWKFIRAHTLSRLGQHDEARREMPPPGAADDASRRLLIEEHLDPPAARQKYLEGAQASNPSLLLLLQAKEFADHRVDLELLEVVCSRATALHPHRATFRWPLAQLMSRQKEHHRVVELIGDLDMPRHLVDAFGTWTVRSYAGVKNWRGMLEHCERWQKYSRSDAHRPPYYTGIALSRLGDYERADASFEQHEKEAAALEKAGGQKKRYLEASLERMWIRVAPDAPPKLRDPAHALEIGGAVIAQRSQARAWMLTVLAEVRFANGDQQAAIRTAEAAEAVIDQADVLAPSNLAEILAAALVRYRQ